MGIIEELEIGQYLIPLGLLPYWYIQNMDMNQYNEVDLCDYEGITLKKHF